MPTTTTSSLSVDFTRLVQLVAALVPKPLEVRVAYPSHKDKDLAYFCVVYENDICDFVYNVKTGVATADTGFFYLVFEECQKLIDESSSSLEWEAIVSSMVELINSGEDTDD